MMRLLFNRRRLGGLGGMLIALGLAACAPNADYRDVAAIFAPRADEPLVVSSEAIDAENIANVQELDSYRVALGAVQAGSFSPTARQIALQGEDRVVRIWDVDTGRLLEEPYEHVGAGEAVVFSPDGTRLLSGGRAGGSDTVLLDVKSYAPIALTSMAGYHVSDAAWAPDGTRYAMVSRGSSRIYIFTGDGEPLTQRRPSGEWLWSVAYSQDWIATVNELGAVYLFQADDFAFRREFWYPARMAARTIAFTPDQSLVVSCHIDGMVNVYEVAGDWAVVDQFPAHEFDRGRLEGCRDSAFTPAGDVYLTVGDDGWLRAWDLTDSRLLYESDFGQPAMLVDVSKDGELIAVALADGTLHLLGRPGASLAQN